MVCRSVNSNVRYLGDNFMKHGVLMFFPCYNINGYLGKQMPCVVLSGVGVVIHIKTILSRFVK